MIIKYSYIDALKNKTFGYINIAHVARFAPYRWGDGDIHAINFCMSSEVGAAESSSVIEFDTHQQVLDVCEAIEVAWVLGVKFLDITR